MSRVGADRRWPDPAGRVDASRAAAAREALATALAAEHAAIFAYGPIGVQLPDRESDAAREAEEAHRTRRDDLVVALAADAPAAEASYQLPFPVTDPDRARELATLVEDRVAAAWRAALPAVTGEDRAGALAALRDAAVRATRWRLAAGEDPATVPFPGASR